MKIHVVLLLAVVNFIHCDECKLMFDLAIVEIGGSLRTIYNHLKGHDQLLQRIPDMQEKLEHLENNLQDMQEKLEHLENNLQGHDELLQRIPDVQEKLQHLENNLQDVHQELGNQKTSFQELHHELEHVKGLSQETGQLVRREVLEHLTNVSAAANEEIKSYVHEEISGVISLAQGHDELLQRIPDMQEKLQHLENNLQDMQEKLEHLENNLQDMQEKLEHLENNLQGHDELLQRIPDMQQKFQHLENNLQDVQEKLEHLENNLQDVHQELGNQKTSFQELHHELEHVKGLSQETGQLVRREVLEHLTNVSAAANEEIKSYVHEEISGVISLAQGHDELLQRIPDMQQKFQHLENNLQDVQEKLEHLENNLQGLSQETGQLVRREVLEHLTNVSAAANEEIKSYVHEEISGVISLAQDMQEKLQHLENNLQGLSRETAQCLKGEDLEHLTNVSAAANQEIKSFHEEMSEVIAWSQKDKCSEGGLLCGKSRTCKNNPFSFTCSCPSGFTWDGSECKEFHCRSPANRIPGLGCLLEIEQGLTFQAMKKKCEEEGMRLAQHMSLQQLQDMAHSFRYAGLWVGVYDGKWTSDGSLVPEDLWKEGYDSDPSRRCGHIDWESSSSSFKLNQRDCSLEYYGYCQFPMP
ncbi:putative leucine-rich repeat-containing protein DDB_G0290503 isoform X8 [Palaemon carinicauda]|uniref:putative leucine-rich repeat-containing protein DDB_G0290503 isoform X8 n=1 Tax=Palaemon carinicauda TaxID=392227 RepID=UPI0035B5E22D